MLTRPILACGILLALPGPATAAGMSISGPAAVSEAAGKATYTVQCGDTGDGLPDLPGVPGVPGVPGLPGVPDLPGDLLRVVAEAAVANTGALNVGLTDGPAPATQPADHGAPSQTLLTCSPGATSFAVVVPIVNDSVDEVNERFTITVNGALVAEGSVSKTIATTITDDDPITTITPLVRVGEGDSAASLTVTFASPAAAATTIAYATEAFSATPGSDFTATSGNLVVPAGQTTGTISVPILGDTVPESPEAFYVNLASTDNGSLGATQKRGIVAIFDDEAIPVPLLSLPKTVSVEEKDGSARFPVTLSSPATQRIQVAWKTLNWTANTRDYGRAKGRLVFQPGQRRKTISVDLKNDRRDEPDEAFGVILESPTAATLGQKGAFGLIADDDGPKVRIGKPRVRGKRLVTTVWCPKTASGCEGALVAKAGKLKLGRKSFDLAKGEKQKLRLKMSKKARRELNEHALRAKLKATVSDASGDTLVTTRKARLKRRG